MWSARTAICWNRCPPGRARNSCIGRALYLRDGVLERSFTRAQFCGLTEQEREVVVLRYGLNGKPPKRQREVAIITGISRSYVSRIEKRALQKLRRELEE